MRDPLARLLGRGGGVASSHNNDRARWFLEYIENKLLPFTLARFFMFDGEQVSSLANLSMSDQVRMGIEQMLGIPVLRQLMMALDEYINIQRNKLPREGTIKRLEKEQKKLKEDCEESRDYLSKIEIAQEKRKKERRELMHELAGIDTMTQDQYQELLEKINTYERSIEDKNRSLEKVMMEDLALAMCDRNLRERVRVQLNGEEILMQWRHALDQGDSNLERFITSLDDSFDEIKPKLGKNQRKKILEKIEKNWEKLWNPPPKECAKILFFPYLSGSERSKIIELLDKVDNFGAPAIIDLLDRIASDKQKLNLLRSQVTRAGTSSPQVEAKRKRLDEIILEIEEKEQEIGAYKNKVTSLEGQIIEKEKDLAKLENQKIGAMPAARRNQSARNVRNMISDIVDKAVPYQVSDIAAEMTDAHRSMAHKKDLVERIEIDEKCNVKLLNAKGMDLRDFELSAGEKQIFTQALIAAVSSVSDHGFPMVVDTPLGRLDIDHRKGVLKHLVQRKHQVILLSTNTEVVGPYLQEIAPHVQKKYLIEFERVGDMGQSNVQPGYFEEEEVQT